MSKHNPLYSEGKRSRKGELKKSITTPLFKQILFRSSIYLIFGGSFAFGFIGCKSIQTKNKAPIRSRIALLPLLSPPGGTLNKSSKVQLKSHIQYLNDLLSQHTKEAVHSHFLLMTRENMETLLPPDRTLEECEGSCEVQTAKLLGADYLIKPTLSFFGRSLTSGSIRISFKIWESKTGQLLGSKLLKVHNLSQPELVEKNLPPQIYRALSILIPSLKTSVLLKDPSSSKTTSSSKKTSFSRPASQASASKSTKWTWGHPNQLSTFSSKRSSTPLHFTLESFTGLHFLPSYPYPSSSSSAHLLWWGLSIALHSYWNLAQKWKMSLGLAQESSWYRLSQGNQNSTWHTFFDLPLVIIPSQIRWGLHYQKHALSLGLSLLNLSTLSWNSPTANDLLINHPLHLQYTYQPHQAYGFFVQSRYLLGASPAQLKTYPLPHFKNEGHLTRQFGLFMGMKMNFTYFLTPKKPRKNPHSPSNSKSQTQSQKKRKRSSTHKKSRTGWHSIEEMNE